MKKELSFKGNLNSQVSHRVRLFLEDRASGARRQVSDWESNLVFDTGLNNLATGFGGRQPGGNVGLYTYLQVGSGNTPNFFNSGASAIFTQSGNTLHSSTGFFTGAMVGGLFKWGIGTGGAEIYITGYTDSQNVTVSTSATVSTPAIGTVWMVQQTALETFLYNTTVKQNGANGTTYSGNTQVNSLTFVFPSQGSVYSVNEIGYTNSSSTSSCYGRIVLSSTVTVPTTDFLVVEFEGTNIQSPSAQIAVGNVGSNVDTAGTAMLQQWCGQYVNSDGSIGQGNYGNIGDGGSPPVIAFHTANDITLHTSIQSITTVAGQASEAYQFSFGSMSNAGNPVGVGTSGVSWSTTSAGETVYFLVFGEDYAFGGNIAQLYVIQLTTPITLPVGTFAGSGVWTTTFTRNLSN
jgi:hypothetical protein